MEVAIIIKSKITAFSLKKMQIAFILLFVILITAILGISMLNGYYNTTAEQNILVFSYLGLFSLILSVITWAILRKEIICPYMFFLLASYVFMYGQCLLWALSLEFEYKDLFKWYTPETIFPGQFFSLLCLQAMHLGAIIAAKANSIQEDDYKYNSLVNRDKIQLSFQAIKITAWILFAVSVVPFLYSTIDNIVYIIKNTYHSSYTRVSTTGRLGAMMDIIEAFFIPSLFMLLIAYQKKRSITIFVVCLCIINIACRFVTGGRTGAFLVFISLICAFHYLVKPFKTKHVIIVLILTYILFAIGTVVAATRNLEGRTLADYIAAYHTASDEANPAVTLVAEMGWTMSNTIEVIRHIPANYDFRYGSTYLLSLTTVIPNLGFWDKHPATVYGNLGPWLQGVMGINFGPGFSPIAEAYTNFGWFGIIFMVFEGAIIGLLSSLSDKYSVKYKPEIMIISLLFMLAIKDITRSSAVVAMRNILYSVIAPYLLVLLVKYTIKHFSTKSSYKNCPPSDSETAIET